METGFFDEERLLDVFRHSPAAMAIVRWRDKSYVEINQEFTQLLGWSDDDVVGRTSAELRLVDEGVAAQLIAGLENATALRNRELPLRTKHGESRQVIMSSDLLHLRGELHAIATFVDITARAHVQAVTNRMAAIVESSDDAIISKDLNSIVTTWNRGAERVFGYSAAEMTGTSILRVIPEDRRHEETVILRQVVHGEGVANLETQRVRKDGRIIDVSITTSPIRDAHGSIVGVSKIARDITDQRRSEEARRSSEARYGALFDHAPDGILIADSNNRYLDANPAICAMLGYSRGELVRLRAEDIIATEQVDQVSAALAGIQRREDHQREWRLRRKDGSILTAEVIATMMPDGTLMGLVRDVTERTRMEARFRRLVDSNAQGVMFWRADGAVSDANDALLHILGCSRNDIGSGAINLREATPPEFADADQRCIEELAQHGVCRPYEKEFTRPDGSRVPVLVGAASFEDSADEGIAFVVDLTEQKKLEQQVFRAQRMESVGTLAGGIAHDLNNILAPILLSIGLLKLEIADARLTALLDTIQACARRGADLVQQVLSFARGVEGKQTVINPLHIVRDLIKVARDTFPRSVDIRLDSPAECWTVLGDSTQLHQVLLNLAVNARDAMPQGGRLTVSIENVDVDATYASMNIDAHPGPYVVFTVADTGSGISEDVRDRIFEPFFTTKDVGKGTGLGLSTTLAIVKSHGGFVHVYSEVGHGAKFKVYWPAAIAESPVAEPQTGEDQLPRGNGEMVLVIDDEDAIRSIAGATLERFGYRVILAGNGAEAVGLFAVHRAEIRAVLTDMAMPVMDGPATIVAIRAIEPTVRIIGSSGLASNDGVAKAVGAGVDVFIPKPYSAAVLLTALRNVLHPSSRAI